MNKRTIFVILAFLVVSAASTDEKAVPVPEPYGENEFPKWLQYLRRAEIVAVGAFPITFLYTDLIYGNLRYALHGFSSEYAPTLGMWTGGASGYEPEERQGVLLAGVLTAVGVAVADLIINLVEESRADD